MLYLAIDQHAKQITVCVRNEEGDTVLTPASQHATRKDRSILSAAHRDGH